MVYSCKDCSYRGNSSGQGGSCLACGSFNTAGKPGAAKAPKPGRLRLILLALLWAYLIALIIWKMDH